MDFGRFFSEASLLTDDFNTAMSAAQAEAAAFGFDVFTPEETQNEGLKGEIRRELTEETGSELLGLFRGQYDVTKRIFEINAAYFERERSHHSAVLNLIAINTQIANNTGATVDKLVEVVGELKDISENTEKHYLLDLG